MEKKEILQQCTVEGNVVKLPNIQLERKGKINYEVSNFFNEFKNV